MDNIFKKVLRFSFVSFFALALFLSLHQYARAADTLQFTSTGGTVVRGYLNATNEGFTVTAHLDDVAQLQKAVLLLDGSVFVPPIEGTSLGNGDVIFTSDTLSPIELQNKVPVGPHTLEVEKYYLSDPASPITGEGVGIVADYFAPTATISSDITTGVLKIGDKVTFTITPSEKLDKVSAVYNNKIIAWRENLDLSWTGIYTVMSGEIDQTVPLALSGVKITDLAGNLTVLANHPTHFTIDANAPKISIHSPENSKVYNTHDILLNYSVDDSITTIQVLLNGQQVDSMANLNLADGSYKLSVQATDSAGNVTIAYSNFSVDTTAPDFSVPTNPDGSRVEKGWTIVFDGTTEPGAKVLIEILSNGQTAETIADSSGHFRLEFLASNLDIGSHDAYITITDQAGNSKRVKISSFEVYSIAPQQKPAKIAFASSSTASDVKPPMVQSSLAKTAEPTEVAKVGQLGSASSTQRAGTNWSAWIILLGLVVFASALATAGYYGYEWLAVSSEARQKLERERDVDEEIIALEGQPDISQTINEIARKSEEPEKKLEEKEEEVPKTRW